FTGGTKPPLGGWGCCGGLGRCGSTGRGRCPAPPGDPPPPGPAPPGPPPPGASVFFSSASLLSPSAGFFGSPFVWSAVFCSGPPVTVCSGPLVRSPLLF